MSNVNILEKKVLNVRTPEKMMKLNPLLLHSRRMSLDEFMHIFKMFNAFWMYKGDPDLRRPHVELTSGKHSNGFVNCGKVLAYPRLRHIFSSQLVRLLYENFEGKIDWVISSDHAGAALVYPVSNLLNVPCDFCEKADGGQKQVWKRHQLPKDSMVFQVEELTTTTGTIIKVRDGINDGNDEPLQFTPLGVLVNRTSPLITMFENKPIISLFELDIENFAPSECPYCKAGSKAVRPKGEHWAELVKTGV